MENLLLTIADDRPRGIGRTFSKRTGSSRKTSLGEYSFSCALMTCRFLSLTPADVERLGSEFHIHLPSTGRINVAGLNESNVETVARAIDRVVRERSN